MLNVDELCNRRERGMEQPFPLHLNLNLPGILISFGVLKVKDLE